MKLKSACDENPNSEFSCVDTLRIQAQLARQRQPIDSRIDERRQRDGPENRNPVLIIEDEVGIAARQNQLIDGIVMREPTALMSRRLAIYVACCAVGVQYLRYVTYRSE